MEFQPKIGGFKKEIDDNGEVSQSLKELFILPGGLRPLDPRLGGRRGWRVGNPLYPHCFFC